MGAFLQDARYGLRMLRKSPGFTAVAVIVLALGIGANTAIFSLVDAVLLRPMPFPEPDRLVMVWEDFSRMGFPENTPAPANFVDWKKQNHVFSGMAAMASRTYNLTGDGDPEKVEGYATEWSTFPLLGVNAALGRTFLPEEDRPEGRKVVVISHGLWQRRFAGDRGLVGRDLQINGEKYTVIGVMPAGFHFPTRESEVWTPLAFTDQEWARRGAHFLRVIARLKPGISLEQARADMSVIGLRLEKEYPGNNFQMGVRVTPLHEQYVGRLKNGLIVLMVAVACVLLIACANIANLLLARTAGRTREMAVRTALGAGGLRVARQLLTENLLLAALGGALGVILALWSFDVLKLLVPAELSQAVPLRLDFRVLAVTVGATLLTGLLFGLAPVLQARRMDLNDALKTGGARGGFGGRSGMRNALVMMEVALALVLLIGAVLLIRSFANLRGVDTGFQTKDVLTFRLVLQDSKYPDGAKRAAFFDRVLEKLQSLPGVQDVGFTSALPLVWKGGSSTFSVEGRPKSADNLPYDANNRVVSPGFMRVMEMRLRAGRFFEESDGQEAPRVAIINETMARMYFPAGNAIGQRIKFGIYSSTNPWIRIAGVVADVKQMGLDVPARPEMYFPYRQAFDNWMVPRDVVIRADNAISLASAARQRVWEVDRNQPVSNIATLDDILDEEVQGRRMQTLLLGAFSGLALLLACIGLYGVLSFLVSQRTQEIGVRMALGAQPSDILSNVAGKGLALTGAGVAVGLVIAFLSTRLLKSMLFGISAWDPLTFFGVPALLVLVSVAACYMPARRAMQVDPMTTLRNE
jgi:putative ABC transport system permease protein